MVRVLLVLAALLAALYGCEQASSPAENQEKREGVEKAREEAALDANL